ncbi:MAG: hypothetical protein MJ170_02660 [Alphaproteobacteria bacterium]|nr:hypothetical protein [Alphaproteobacteria bacterium]
MATLESSIKLHDNMSRTLHAMNNAISSVIDSFETLKGASQDVVDPTLFDDMRSSVYDAAEALNDLEDSFRGVEDSQNGVVDNTEKINDGFDRMQRWAFGLGSLYKVFNFAKESMDMSDIQRSSEIQLQTVLANVGASADAFDRLSKKASGIQGKGIYGDEAMIAGAAELATYVSNVDALEQMMDTLSNFAMGMSGGGAVDPKQMVQYATQLGKAANGSYDGLMKKGFSLSEAQQEIIKNGTDMQKALVLEEVIGESWQKLYENMSNTPEGRIIQFNNALGDMREIIGNKLYVALDSFISKIVGSLPEIEKAMDGIGNGFALIATALGNVASISTWAITQIIDKWSVLAPIIGTVTSALLIYKGVIVATNAYTTISTLLSTIYSNALLVQGWHNMMVANYTTFAAIAQKNFNLALLACPITWIIGGVMAFIAALYMVVGVYNQLTGSTISATGIIIGAFRVMFAFIYNMIAYVANAFVGFCEFLNNVFIDPLTAIQNLFITIWNGVVGVVGQAVGQIIKLMGKIPFLSKVLPSDFNVGSWMIEKKNIAGGINNAGWGMGFKDYKSEFLKGYGTGSKMFEFPQDPMQAMQLNTLNKVASNTADTAGNTAKMKDSMDMKDTDLKYLHDIAEREVVNRFTSAEIKLDMTNNNNISSDVDIDFVIAKLSDSITETMLVAAEGIHA